VTFLNEKDYDYASGAMEGPASVREAARDFRGEASALIGKSLAEAEG
jgi:hypothetical protein